MGKHWRWHIGAALLYGLTDYGTMDHGVSLTREILGTSSDPTLIMWFLAWWPWALGHHLYPLYTHLIWQPAGLNLAWTTCVPTLALLMAPVTLLSGPVLSFNILMLAAPFLAAMAAYGLCLYVTKKPAAALLGGYLFGVSAYEMAQSIDHLNLNFCVCVPLLLWLALARLDGAIGRGRFVTLAVLLLACQFGISAEIFATGLFFAGVSWLVVYARLTVRRAGLQRLVVDGLIVAPILLVVLSPLLWAMFLVPHDIRLPDFWPVLFSTNLLNFFLPTVVEHWGVGLAYPITAHLPGFTDEQNGYLGLPLLLIIWRYWKQTRSFLVILAALFALCSMGPWLWVGPVQSLVPLPWALLRHMPLIGAALPARFMMYTDLVTAIIAARWVAAAQPEAARRRLIIGAIAAISLMPAPHQVRDIPESQFFAPGRVQAVLGPAPKILILPFGILGNSSYWQAESQFRFAQTGGYLGYPPGAVQTDKSLMRFYFGLSLPDFASDFTRFCQRTGTDYVVAGPGTKAPVLTEVKALGWPARQVDDVTIFTVPK
jgi:hypothetical protein